MSRLKELREKRAAAHAKAVEFLAKEQTPEIRQSVDAALAEVDTIGADIKRIEQADAVEAELRAATGSEVKTEPVSKQSTKTIEQRASEYRKAFMSTLRNTANFASGKPVSKHGIEERDLAVMEAEVRAMIETRTPGVGLLEGALLPQIGTYTGLGFFVPAGFVYDVEQATKYYAPLLDGSVIRVLETASGQPLPYPTSNDTSQEAVIVGESEAVDEKDVTASHINFGAYKLTSGLVKCSLELLQDSAFDLDAWLIARFAERWGRGLETYLTNGVGGNQPTGILPAIAASGATAIVAAGSAESSGGSETGANSIGHGDLVRLEHSVDPTYRRNAKYMMHDTTVSYLKRILDKFGRPLWTPGMVANAPDRINGYPYVINQKVPQIGASNVTVVYGDFSKYMARKVKDLQVLRLDERFADFGQVAFVSFARIDANLLDAGTHPLNVLQQHS